MEAHYLSMIIIGIGSFVSGILPMTFCFRVRKSYPFFLSLILCLGAGVLLATSLVHILTEVQEILKLYAQLYFCAGLLCLYMFDEISHYFLYIKKSEVHSVSTENQRHSYGAIQNSISESENSPFLELRTNEALFNDKHFQCKHCNLKIKTESHQGLLGTSLHSENNEEDQIVCHLTDVEYRSPNPTAKIGLLISLLMHSILEGVSIGVQTKISQILLILGAITFHKIVLSFCLGLELNFHGYAKLPLLVAIFLFSIGSPIGILLGLSITSLKSGIISFDAELQAIAAGSLLYIALLEVLPRERSKWRATKKTAGIFQLIFLLIGFAGITLFHFFIDIKDASGNQMTNATKKFS